ncbi:MAG: threonine/serine dehydratase [Ornithinimicrobium sp.]
MPSNSSTPPTRDDISAAKGMIRSRVRRTPVMDLELDSGVVVTLKLELFQHTGSFKPRGAFTCVLSQPELPSTLVAASGGNHGLAVAHVGQVFGIPTEIFVPRTAPRVKVERLDALGATVHQVGQRYAEALEASLDLAEAPGALAIHAYDTVPTLTGQGTVAAELDEQTEADTVFVAVGGGGLIGGMASWWGSSKGIIAVEPQSCPAMHHALEAGRPVPVEPSGVAADSLGASQIGALGFAAVRAASGESVLVSDDDIRQARQWLWRAARIAAEPGGVTALAALTSGAYVPSDGERITVVVCGANADPGDLTPTAADQG